MASKQSGSAKLTLTLRMKDKRTDGFNNLEALTVFLDRITDTLEMEENPTTSLLINGDSRGELIDSDPNNLVLVAISLFHRALTDAGFDERYIKNFSCSLTKSIPVQAGLGGGSVDAAIALRLLNEFYGHPLTKDAISNLAAELGSDVSVCVNSQTCWMSGRGENVEPVDIDFSDYSVVVVTPHILCSTPEVFRRYEELGRPIDVGIAAPEHVRECTETLHNDLSIAAYDLYPELLQEKNNIEEQTGSPFRLAGSGSTLFTFGVHEEIENIYRTIKSKEKYRLCGVSSIA